VTEGRPTRAHIEAIVEIVGAIQGGWRPVQAPDDWTEPPSRMPMLTWHMARPVPVEGNAYGLQRITIRLPITITRLRYENAWKAIEAQFARAMKAHAETHQG
jgi:hypothetical protein